MTDKIMLRWIVICVVVLLAAWSLAENPLEDNLGIDLRGGVTLTYEVDSDSIKQARRDSSGQSLEDALEDTVRVISARINTLGVKDLSVRREGSRRILIQAPAMLDTELEEIKRRMVQLGQLEFPIGMGRIKGKKDPTLKIYNEDGSTSVVEFREADFDKQLADRIAQDWPAIRKAVGEGRQPEENLYRPGKPYNLVHEEEARTEIVWKPWSAGEAASRLNQPGGDDYIERTVTQEEVQAALSNARKGAEYDKELILGGWLYFDPDWYGAGRRGFSGRDVKNVSRGEDQLGGKAVNYEISRDRQGDFEDYTQKFIDHAKCLVLNDEIWSNPTIQSALSDSVQITGGGTGFTEEDQTWLIDCLQSGSLRLRPSLQSEDNVEATLGDEAVASGVLATMLGGLLVVVFMVFYYRFSGVVAVVALVLNLGLMLAMLALFQATITLPGIAGIILTIGMSVDANILIFERIREELSKGKTLVSSVQTGFDRAFVTIIDANLTTVITAVILYQYGVGPIKGFAVTLMAGIACSLFTALFVAKTIFATAIGKELIRGGLNMTRWVPADLSWDFIGKVKKAAVASVVGIVAALAIFFGSDPYGLDFTGGTIVRMTLEGDVTSQEVKDQVSTISKDDGTTLFPNVAVTKLVEQREIGGKAHTSYDIHLQTVVSLDSSEAAQRVEPELRLAFAEAFDHLDEPTKDERSDEWSFTFHLKAATATESASETVNAHADTTGRRPFEIVRVLPVSPNPEDETATAFRFEINEKSLIGKDEILEKLIGVFGDKLPKESGNGGAVAQALAFPKLNFVGPNVVANLKQQAIVAVILSLIALILYIWFRFKEIKYGFAAAIAVFHDVIIALGVVVLFNSLGIVHVPINLPIIAGFLTIIGYSLNDTIVLFDRVRENLGNIKGSFGEIVNHSINQTLARTLLTSLTTFAVVFILLILNYGAESPIEGIAFTLMVGVLVGTYSSIFIASPLVIWFHDREERRAKTAKG